MMYDHYSLVPWDAKRWPNFSVRELSCPHCGESCHEPYAVDCIQRARAIVRAPFKINSAHRCWLHNARVRGAPRSQHKKIAFDIALAGHDRQALKEACRQAGFTGFGHYGTFLHVDLGRPRWWASKAGRKVWNF